MINYSLKCSNKHSFESWFQSADAFEKLQNAGMVTCAICGSTQVTKAIMAPRVNTASTPAPMAQPNAAPETAQKPLQEPPHPAQQALKDFKAQMEKNADYVGSDFAQEARDMHYGLTPERAIYGEAKATEAKKLVEEGIPVAPLPFDPKRKTN